ncbi:phospholipase D family protein [Rhizobium sp. 18055]|uniref:phospholipase D family protein n=1 Tax=Rhizobium sp. 18055 TaxID=2681403 RepID=UPI001359DDFA|nr:phospholipase D family protein [Rhizobium sp. 18055]
MKFLDESTVLESIRASLSMTDTATLVVAFWGNGAVERLGLDKPWKSLRVVCNLESGACNPAEITRLRAVPNVEVRTDWRLHGKVYLTQNIVILGSSNASSNGLVVEGAAALGWAEANIESSERKFIEEIATWCATRFQQAIPIDDGMLDLARASWSARRSFAPVAGSLTADLIDLVRREPNHVAFENIKVVQWARKASPEANAVFLEALETDQSLTGTDIYEGWGTDMAVDDWLIDFNVGKRKPEFTGYWKVVFVDERNDVTFVRPAEAIELPALGKLSVRAEEYERVVKAMAQAVGLGRGPKEKIARIADVVAKL